LKNFSSTELKKLQNFYPELEFSEDLDKTPELAEFLRMEIAQYAMRVTDPLGMTDAPKFNDDFSNYFVINNMPKVSQEKLPKLVGLIGTTLNKKKLTVEEENIDIPINPETNTTDGVAFIKMRNEEDARLGVTTFDGIKLGGKTFATCLFPEFEKIMNINDTFAMP